jgi:peptidoglycan/xylan/chitin deacetylase (PgdA/CDA1 family)
MIPSLFYHQVLPADPSTPAVTPEEFRGQMDYLRRRGYAFLGLDSPGDSGKAVRVSFDDGFACMMEHVVPTLVEQRIPAAFFIVAGAVGGKDSWHCGREPLLEWAQLREMVRQGLLIGSHSMSHPRLNEVSSDQARAEIVDSKKLLEDRLGVAIDHFAYPKGRWNAQVADLVREAGYKAGWATRSGDGSPFARRRHPVAPGTGAIRFATKVLRIRLNLA